MKKNISHISPLTPTPASLRAPRAFTLIELLVVAAIVIIIMAVTFPAYNKLTSGNAKKQAVNAISAQAASARSLALSLQKQVALLFYEDPANRYQTRMVLVQAINNVSGGTEFGAIPDRPPVSLPRFVKVSTLDVTTTSGAFQAEWGTGGQKCRALVFDERGRPVTRSGLKGFDIGGTSPRSASADWGLASGGDNPATFASARSLVVYDITEFNQANPTGTADTVKATWLLNNSDIISINPYTGLVLR